MFTTLAAIPDQSEFDIVVMGAGAAGLSAALYAAIAGQRTLLVERTDTIGGTSALSAAAAWVPGTAHGRTVNPDDTPENALRFLDAAVGNQAPRELRQAFLASAATAIETLEAKSDVKFRPFARHPDYLQQYEGATVSGRALEPVPFDGRVLGTALHRIRPPIPEFTLFGGMMVDRTDITALLSLTKSFASLKHAARVLGHYGRDRLAGPRGTRLVMGNALIGRLLASVLARGVSIITETRATELNHGKGRVSGITLQDGAVMRTLRVQRAVISASGGFGRDPQRRKDLFPSPTPHLSPAAPGHTGEMQALARSIGARFANEGADAAFWAPVSTRTRPNGTAAVFPHFVLDRAKPGTVCVNAKGERFVNEAVSYHDFARAMMATGTVPAYLIADAVALKKYGLGMVRPGARGLASFKDDGYLIEADSIDALAKAIGADAQTLRATIEAMNGFAQSGVDTQFGRGTTAYHRHNGDATHTPSPNLGPIRTAPFYAVKLYPGDIGAAAGLATDTHAQVLDQSNQPIAGFYAIGNDMASIMGGTYPGPGITIGPAIVFAYRAIQHATGAA